MIGKERVDEMTRMEKWENEVLQLKRGTRLNEGINHRILQENITR